eukprot:5080428-Prorocentrum_lima.AAC.1
MAPMRGVHMSSELDPLPDTPPGPRGGSPNGPSRDRNQLLPTGIPSGLGVGELQGLLLRSVHVGQQEDVP